VSQCIENNKKIQEKIEQKKIEKENLINEKNNMNAYQEGKKNTGFFGAVLDVVGIFLPVLGMFSKAKKFFEVGSIVLEGANKIRD
jgi:hypothetical protein